MCGHSDVVTCVDGAVALDFASVFVSASQRIWLHAAIYNRFAENAGVADALREGLRNPAVHLEVVLLPVWRDVPWMDAACRVIRPFLSRAEVRERAEVSAAFFASLSKQFAGQVTVREATVFPAVPMVLVDSTLFSGQYMHSTVLAPEGHWIRETVPVETLMPLAEQAVRENRPVSSTLLQAMPARLRAQLRYIEEWVRACASAVE
ncbi:MAG: hypothetical protein MI749_21205 [Desulfovibrionales bacterium]|nr:hypothetical protein [Desulfovibrionales bacterium]